MAERNGTSWRDVVIGILVALLAGIIIDAKVIATPALSEERVRAIVNEKTLELSKSIQDLTTTTTDLRVAVADLQATIRRGTR